MPPWDDDDFNDDEGDEWKQNATLAACKELYNRWQQVTIMLNGAMESLNTKPVNSNSDQLQFPEDYWEDYKQNILGDAYQVAVKIRSSEAGGIYVLRMENAAIIRKNAMYIYSALLTLMHEQVLEKSYVMAIRSEIDQFRELFKNWLATFQKDEYEDEWGLFI